MIVLSLVACGNNEAPTGGEDNTPETTQSGENSDGQSVSQTDDKSGESTDGIEKETEGETLFDLDGTFTAKQIAFIDSLGKCEEGKYFIARKGSNGYLTLYIIKWNEDAVMESMTEYTVYYTNATYTAAERYEKAMDEYESKWNLYESQNIDPATALAVYTEISEEIWTTTVDRTESAYADMLPYYNDFDQIAEELFGDAILIK